MTKINKQRRGIFLGGSIALILIGIVLVLVFGKSDMMKIEETAPGQWVVLPQKDLNTKAIRLGIFNTFAWDRESAEQWREGLEKINQRLQKLSAGYHLELEMSAGRLESPEDLDTLQVMPDIVLGYGVMIPEAEMENAFLDLMPYLKSSALSDIYKKRSETYWVSRREATGMYNLASYSGDRCKAVKVNVTKCGEIGYTVPELTEPIGLSVWEREFEAIYRANGNKPFIYFSNMIRESVGELTGILQDCFSYSQTSIYSGLNFDGYEAVFPYNEAVKEQLMCYQKWAEKGYITEDYEQALIEFVSAGQKNPYEYVIEINENESGEILENTIAIFPIQGEPLYRTIDRMYLRSIVCAITKEGANPELAMELFCMMNADEEIRAEMQSLDMLGQAMRYEDQESIPDQIFNIGLKELSLDITPIRQEVERINRIAVKYAPRFRLAYYDRWIENYDQMIKEMYENGAQTIVDEVNRQLK